MPQKQQQVSGINGSSLEFIMAYEAGECDEDEIVRGFQGLIDSGLVWQLQGSYGRMAAALIRGGQCHE